MDRPDYVIRRAGNSRIRLAFPAFETNGNPFFPPAAIINHFDHSDGQVLAAAFFPFLISLSEH